jgi:hypothetical protein
MIETRDDASETTLAGRGEGLSDESGSRAAQLRKASFIASPPGLVILVCCPTDDPEDEMPK